MAYHAKQLSQNQTPQQQGPKLAAPILNRNSAAISTDFESASLSGNSSEARKSNA